MSSQLPINISEVFCSIDGEGVRAGEKAIFIRFTGCSIHCDYCDTPYALHVSQRNPAYAKVEDVAEAVLKYCVSGVVNNITITGGEPLLYPDTIVAILNCLNSTPYAFSINIETNGTIDPKRFLDLYKGSSFYHCQFNELFFTFDIKTPAAGADACSKGLNAAGKPVFVDTILQYTNEDCIYNKEHPNVIKAVVGSVQDLDYVRNIFMNGYTWRCQDYKWYMSPVFGHIEPADIVSYILARPEIASWSTQVQLHKIIWDKDKRGV